MQDLREVSGRLEGCACSHCTSSMGLTSKTSHTQIMLGFQMMLLLTVTDILLGVFLLIKHYWHQLRKNPI